MEIENLSYSNDNRRTWLVFLVDDGYNISNVTFDAVKMPWTASYATTLAQLNITDRAFASGASTRPAQRPEPVS